MNTDLAELMCYTYLVVSQSTGIGIKLNKRLQINFLMQNHSSIRYTLVFLGIKKFVMIMLFIQVFRRNCRGCGCSNCLAKWKWNDWRERCQPFVQVSWLWSDKMFLLESTFEKFYWKVMVFPILYLQHLCSMLMDDFWG